MEIFFDRATRYGLQHARWCRLWRVKIEEYLTATIQDLMVLLRNIKEASAALSLRANRRPMDNLLVKPNAKAFKGIKALTFCIR